VRPVFRSHLTRGRAVPTLLVLFVGLLVGLSAPCQAAKKALVIGNDAYRNIPELRKAVTDAAAVASALRSIGFSVLVAQNQDRQTMSQALLAFDRSVEKDDVAFFFFAGHRFEIAGRNFLLPTDVPAATEGEEELIKDSSFPVDAIIDRVHARGAQTTIMVLDACRNNPFARPGTRALPGAGGLTPLNPPEGTFVLFSAGAKQTALDALGDSDPDPNSVFHPPFRAPAGEPRDDVGAAGEEHAKRGQAGRRPGQAPADAGLLRRDRR
jgi:hypothetical protein